MAKVAEKIKNECQNNNTPLPTKERGSQRKGRKEGGRVKEVERKTENDLALHPVFQELNKY